MRKIFIILLSLVCFCGTSGATFSSNIYDKSDTLYQVSTINALVEGIYDGDVTVKQLKKVGDLGIGTFNSLDGEMVILDGKCYQVKSDGTIQEVDNDAKTPFASVVKFKPNNSYGIGNIKSLKEFIEMLDKKLPSENLIYAFKIRGEFKSILTRSVPKQEPPYKKLTEVVKTQPKFKSTNLIGTIVGYKLPEFINKINVPGYHFHFISDEKNAGGHVLDCEISNAIIEVDVKNRLYILFPDSADFTSANISKENKKELESVEK